MEYSKVLSQEFNILENYAQNIINLLDEGNTIPFIARYRKEMHGSMDDQLIREFSDKLDYYRNLDKRREEIRELISAQEKLTDEIAEALDKAAILSELEDIYRPFRPKRKTRASVAKEKGLEPLALAILEQKASLSPITESEKYIDSDKGVENAQDALTGAMDIIAEQISDDADIRKDIRSIANSKGVIEVKAVNEENDSVYAQYYSFSEGVAKIPNHRILAINRGEKEGFLKVNVVNDTDRSLDSIYKRTLHGDNECTKLVKDACDDAYQRLIYPSIEREIRSELTEKASESAIKVFASMFG